MTLGLRPGGNMGFHGIHGIQWYSILHPKPGGKMGFNGIQFCTQNQDVIWDSMGFNFALKTRR